MSVTLDCRAARDFEANGRKRGAWLRGRRRGPVSIGGGRFSMTGQTASPGSLHIDTLLWGAEDTVTPIAQARALKAWMPEAELVVLQGVGHIPHIEGPQALAQALIDRIDAARP